MSRKTGYRPCVSTETSLNICDHGMADCYKNDMYPVTKP